jgi:septum formation protein
MMDFTYAPIVLASASPRRRELLDQLGVPHAVLAVDIDESPLPGESAIDMARRLARSKAVVGRSRDHSGHAVLGADTVVVVDGVVFGKPQDKADAVRMLCALAGRTHRVLTAVALALPLPHPRTAAAAAGDAVLEAMSTTEVHMRPVAFAEAEAYWDTGEPAGKAGGYAIQGRGAVFIEHIRGSYSGVMGLPLYETAQLLHARTLSGEAR